MAFRGFEFFDEWESNFNCNFLMQEKVFLTINLVRY